MEGKSRLQILVSAVEKDADRLPKIMNIQSDAVIVNQTANISEDRQFTFNGHTVKVLNRNEKGVGLSRNTALDVSDHEIIQFADEDIVYSDGYVRNVLDEFDRHPEADVLLFNVKAQPGRETYWNEDFARVKWHNYGRYPAYAIFARREKVIASGVRYSLLFGGGAPYMNGEDSLFLHDLLKKGLKIYRTPVAIGNETPGESTWLKGYNDKFFFDRGVLYHFLYGRLALLWGARFIFLNRKRMCREKSVIMCYRRLADGIKHGKTLETKG